MIYAPSPTEDNGGRGASGRFAAGNSFARGNPHHVQVAKLRSALLKAVGEDDLTAIVRTLVVKARQGDVMAAREVLDRCLGKAKQSLDVEIDSTHPDAMPRFEDMSDLELATLIVEGGMLDKMPPILRQKIEFMHNKQWKELVTLDAQLISTATPKTVRRAGKKQPKKRLRKKPINRPADEGTTAPGRPHQGFGNQPNDGNLAATGSSGTTIDHPQRL